MPQLCEVVRRQIPFASCQAVVRNTLTDDRHLLHPRAVVRSAFLRLSCCWLSVRSVMDALWRCRRAAEYWPLVMDIARRNNLKRIVRCGQIMGRSEEGEMSAAQIFYPCMQCADIFFLKVQLASMRYRQQCCVRLPRVAVSAKHDQLISLLQCQPCGSKEAAPSTIRS